MQIVEVHIQNFRCFKDAVVKLAPRFNLIVGVNGSGKTSLLTALAAVMNAPMNGVAKKGGEWIHADESNAHLEVAESHGRIRYERRYPVRIEAVAELAGARQTWFVQESGEGRNQTQWSPDAYFAVAKLVPTATPLPLVVFYRAERRWALKGISAHQAVQTREARNDGYDSWENADTDMKSFEAWVIAKSLERIEGLARASEDVVVQDELSLVNMAVEEALPESRGVRYDVKYRRLVVDWVNGTWTPFASLSDGQRGMVALFADIARRMCLLNPDLGERVLEMTPGVVLIDELDMHLHPQWQRRITHALRRAFPKVQFVAASHSPQIIGELDASEVLLLGGAEILGHPERSLGLSSGEVLEELMGSVERNPDVKQALARIEDAIEVDDLLSAQRLVDDLRTRIGDIPEILEAQSAIKSLRPFVVKE
jgi:predicted ATP-binding protein involved in virulence